MLFLVKIQGAKAVPQSVGLSPPHFGNCAFGTSTMEEVALPDVMKISRLRAICARFLNDL
jgi:hypothetical protein